MRGSTVATFTRLRTVLEIHPANMVRLELTEASHLTINEAPSDEASFGDGLEHELVYGPGENILNAGSHENGQEFYIGDDTAIAASGVDPHLDLYLHCSFPISSDFQQASVRQNWNTTGVDVTLSPVLPGHAPQRLELVSPNLAGWWGSKPVVFVDVPCAGPMRDLDIEGTEASADYAHVHVVNEYDNSAIDEGPASTWVPRSGPGPAEAGLFRCVAVGGNRELHFWSDQGVIYYWGSLTFYPSTTVYLDDVAVNASAVFKPATGSFYGDWHGRCKIGSSELAELKYNIDHGIYDPRMDCDCDGVLRGGNDGPELQLFLANMALQPGCPPDCLGESLLAGAAGADEGSVVTAADDALDGAVDSGGDVPPPDSAELATWLASQLSPEDLAAFVATATATAALHEGDEIGADLAQLLIYLP